MNAIAKKRKLKKTKIAFCINLSICLISMIIGIEFLDSLDLWKIIACAVSFIISLNIIILITQELIRLQKVEN